MSSLPSLAIQHSLFAPERSVAFTYPTPEANTIPGISLFSGIGGFELGMEPYGHRAIMFCEIEPAGQAVLRAWQPRVPLHADIRLLDELPRDGRVMYAGFPCTNLSKSGTKDGIFGAQTGLVRDVFRLLKRRPVEWVILENVPDLLSLHGGIGIAYVTEQLDALGYRWAYRVVNSRYFGVPQRRQRVFIVATRHHDPREVLLVDNVGEDQQIRARDVDLDAHAVGFYWSEGKGGLGLAVDGIPPLKAAYTIPAVLLPNGELGTIDIRDAERAQALPPEWTRPGEINGQGGRWRLVGNAVTRTVPNWIAGRMENPAPYASDADPAFTPGTAKWPKAAWSMGRGIHVAAVTENPCGMVCPKIAAFLQYPMKPLSERATAGFLGRAKASRLNFPPNFITRIERHLERVQADATTGDDILCTTPSAQAA